MIMANVWILRAYGWLINIRDLEDLQSLMW
jgi:hypothetical protein